MAESRGETPLPPRRASEHRAAASARRPSGGELVIPVAAIGFTLYFFSTIWNSPWTAQVSAFLIGGILILLCLAFLVRTALELRQGEASLRLGGLVGREDLRTGRLWLALATVGYVLLIDWGGFTLTTFAFLVVGMSILNRGRRLPLIVGLSAAMAFGGWVLFIWAFDTRFPRGPFEDWMRMVLGNG